MATSGGVRPGAGRPKGARNKKTQETIERVEASGLMPLDYMLRIMRDESADQDRRDWAAEKAAPYLHAKLVAQHNTNDQKEQSFTEWLNGCS